MNRNVFIASLGFATALFVGCASAPQETADGANSESQAVAASCSATGSNIRRRDCRDGVDTLSRKDIENRAHDAVPQRPERGVPTN